MATWGVRPDARRGVLVVRLDAIGDFVLWLDAAARLRSAYDGHRITLAASAAVDELARKLPYWDAVWAFDVDRLMRHPGYRWRWIRRVARAGFEVAIQPTFSRTALGGDAIVRASGAPQRIGSVGDCSNARLSQKRVADRWYTRLVEADPRPCTELWRHGEFLRGLIGHEAPLTPACLPVLAPMKGALETLKDRPFFVIFPGAGRPERKWPTDRFAEVIDRVHRNTGWMPVLCGAAADEAECAAITSLVSTPTHDLAGRTSLVELCEVIRSAHLVVSNETSASHIAAACRTRSVSVLGGGHFGRFMPYPPPYDAVNRSVFHEMPCYGCNWQCHLPHDPGKATPCITSVTTESVMSVIDALLAAHPLERVQSDARPRCSVNVHPTVSVPRETP